MSPVSVAQLVPLHPFLQTQQYQPRQRSVIINKNIEATSIEALTIKLGRMNIKLLILQSYKITFLTAARHATKTPSLATLADSHLQSSTSLLKPCSLTTSCAKTGSLHNLSVIKLSY